MMFKAVNDLAPDYLSTKFNERSTPGYVLRDYKQIVPLPALATEVQLSGTI